MQKSFSPILFPRMKELVCTDLLLREVTPFLRLRDLRVFLVNQRAFQDLDAARRLLMVRTSDSLKAEIGDIFVQRLVRSSRSILQRIAHLGASRSADAEVDEIHAMIAELEETSFCVPESTKRKIEKSLPSFGADPVFPAGFANHCRRSLAAKLKR